MSNNTGPYRVVSGAPNGHSWADMPTTRDAALAAMALLILWNPGKYEPRTGNRLRVVSDAEWQRILGAQDRQEAYR